MKQKIFMVSLLFVFASSLFANTTLNNDSLANERVVQRVVSNSMLDPWTKEVGLRYNMAILAKIYKNATLFQPTGVLLGVFKDSKCWGYGGIGNSPVGPLMNITIGYNSATASTFTYKVYDATTGKIYDVEETVNFASGVPVGAINAPISLNVKFNITASSSDVSKGTISGVTGSFSSNQTVQLTATPLAGNHFVRWTDGNGGTVMSTSADYTFSATENRTLIAVFEKDPITITTPTVVSSITNASTTDVIISGSAAKLTIDALATLKSLSLANGGQIVLPNTSTLSVLGNFELKSDPENGTATFVDSNPNGGLTVNGTTTVQQYLTGSGGATPNGRFWYVGTPVSGATSAVFDAAGSNLVWYYDEPTHAYVEITNNTTPLVVGKGYVVRLGSNTTVTFTGTLVTGSKVMPLTNTDGHAKSGFNLIVNPYPSFVNIETALSGTVSPSIWTRSQNGGSQMVFDTYNTSLHLGTSASGKPATPYIAPMQAYWVKLTSGTTGSVSTNNSMRTLQDVDVTSNRLKAPAVKNASQKVLRLKVSNGVSSDETVIAFNPNALDGFDGFDSPKMSNENAKVPEIYTTVDNKKVAINGMNDVSSNQSISLEFSTGETNMFTIEANEILNFDADTKIILMDNVLNTEKDITNGAVYTYHSNPTVASRFNIVFKSASVSTGVSENRNESLNVYMNADNRITITNNTEKFGKVLVTNLLGQNLVNLPTTGKTTIIENSFKAGIYFINVTVGNTDYCKKIIIK